MQLHREGGLCINTHLYKVLAAGLNQHTAPTVPASRWGQTAVLWCAPCKGLNTHSEMFWPWKGSSSSLLEEGSAARDIPLHDFTHWREHPNFSSLGLVASPPTAGGTQALPVHPL